MNRFSKSSLCGPVFFESITYEAIINTEPFTQLGNASSAPKHCNDSVVSAVPVLFFDGGPLAVLRRVVSIIVNSVKRFSVWLLSHVSNEVLKLLPTFTNSDSTTTVIREGFVSRIAASVMHPAPKNVNSGTTVSMGTASLRDKLSLQATTGSGGAPYEIIVKCFNHVSAIALAFACRMTLTAWKFDPLSLPEHNKLSKPSSGWYRFSRHMNCIRDSMFSSGLRAATRARCELTTPCRIVNA